MNEQVVVIAIGLVLAAAILWPMVRRPKSGTPREATSLPAGTSEQLAELELDRSMGRVNEEDYARFRAELEATSPTSPIVVEGASPPREMAEELVRRWKKAPRPSCPKCGIRPEPEAAFCSNCGTRLGA